MKGVIDNSPNVQNLEDFSPYDSNVKWAFLENRVIFAPTEVVKKEKFKKVMERVEELLKGRKDRD
ncbi:MAG: hypothetical protein R2879_09775 [Saprospiraceae bacterium]